MILQTINIRFINTLQFQNVKLFKLADNLRKIFNDKYFTFTIQVFGKKNIDLMCGKLLYAYKFT